MGKGFSSALAEIPTADSGKITSSAARAPIDIASQAPCLLDHKKVKGLQTWPDETSYDGDWKGDLFHGKGTFTWKTDSTPATDEPKRQCRSNAAPQQLYMGDWVDGMRSGCGKMWFYDGAVYDGEWCNDLRSGKGRFALSESRCIYCTLEIGATII